MARIRTVKPEFWTAEQVMECSLLARLLFIGMWNFCDDGGNHVASHKTLKAEIFPADDITASDVGKLLSELIENGLVDEYEVDGRAYWHVTGWHHQKIDQPTYKHPAPDGTVPEGAPKRRSQAKQPEQKTDVPEVLAECSPNTSGTFAECAPPEGNGREGKGVNLKSPNGDMSAACADVPVDNSLSEVKINGKHAPICPHQAILDLYHAKLPQCVPVRVWNDTRRRNLQALWRGKASELHWANQTEGISWFDAYFDFVGESVFLTGKADGKGDRPPFVADLEWIIRPSNFAKIVEGKYHK